MLSIVCVKVVTYSLQTTKCFAVVPLGNGNRAASSVWEDLFPSDVFVFVLSKDCSQPPSLCLAWPFYEQALSNDPHFSLPPALLLTHLEQRPGACQGLPAG